MKADLTGGAVGETRLVVGCQVEIGRTGTLVPSAGRQQTQVAAASVCNLTLVFGNCTERPEGRSVNHRGPPAELDKDQDGRGRWAAYLRVGAGSGRP